MKSISVVKADNQGLGISLVYLHLGRRIIKQYGIEGDAALRRAIVRYATIRGSYVRKLHLDLGMKINLKNHYYYNTNPYHDSSVSEDIGHVTEQEDVRRVDSCPFADFLLKCNERYLLVTYCEEAHPPLWQSYAPTTIVNLGKTIGQEHSDHCDFDVFLRPGRMTDEQRKECFEEYDKDFKGDHKDRYKFMTPKEGAISKIAIMVNEFFYEFVNSFGIEARQIVIEGIEDSIRDYYMILKQSAKENGLTFDDKFISENCCYGETAEEDKYWDIFASNETTSIAIEHIYKVLKEIRSN